MKQPHYPLIISVFVMGLVIAILSYLFHPDIGFFKLIVNGQPINNTILGFAALPSALAVIVISAVLVILLFLGVGLVLFWIALFFGLFAVFLMVPFFWPVLIVIFLMFVMLSPRHDA